MADRLTDDDAMPARNGAEDRLTYALRQRDVARDQRDRLEAAWNDERDRRLAVEAEVRALRAERDEIEAALTRSSLGPPRSLANRVRAQANDLAAAARMSAHCKAERDRYEQAIREHPTPHPSARDGEWGYVHDRDATLWSVLPEIQENDL